MNPEQSIPCRLCGGASHFIFNKEVLGDRTVRYFACESCGSQQTEYPDWLDRAYAIPGVHIDVGCASRTLKNWLGATTLFEMLDIPRSAVGVDFGAAYGLFARLMRDTGHNAFSNDKYTTPAYTSYFNVDDISAERPRYLTAFEVFEHLPDPAQTLDQLFSLDADFVLFTTWFCDNQAEDWIYYLPDCGQHVFFYSDKGMREFAARHGYEMVASHFFMILYKRDKATSKQIEAITQFSLNSLKIVSDATLKTVNSVIMGNAFIDQELIDARARFALENHPPRRP
ncbi:MAG: class I SAM-dependent methyltransferase [Bosea sp. (in: a-proteobacteria)]